MDDRTFLNFTCGTPVRVEVLDGTQEEQLDLEDEGFIDPTQGRRKGARGVNFTSKEDETLCRSREEVSLDAITGNEQAGSTYWERIHDIFKANNTSGILRSQVSLTHRWSTISTECGEWSACVEQAERLNPSGANAQDKINIAQDLYKGKQKKKGGKGGNAFGLQHCWAILQHGEKWRTRGNEVPNKRQKSNNSATPSYADFDEDGDSSDDDGKRSPTPSSVAPAKKRPDGRKKEKDKLKKGGDVNYKESWDNMISTRKMLAAERMQLKTQEMEERKPTDERKEALEERRAAADERRGAAEERKAATAERKVAAEEMSKRFEQEQKLMFMDPNSLDEKGRSYFEIMCDQILASKMEMGGYGGFVGYAGGSGDMGGNGGSNNDGNGSG